MRVLYNSPTMTENWLAAYQHICHTRRKSPPNADIRDLRLHWLRYGDEMLHAVLRGTYRLSPMQVAGKEAHPMWCAQDAVLALVTGWLRCGKATFVVD